MYSLYLLKFVHKQHHSKLSQILVFTVMRERKNTELAKELNTTCINKFKTSFGQKSIKVLAACMFNDLPRKLKKCNIEQ